MPIKFFEIAPMVKSMFRFISLAFFIVVAGALVSIADGLAAPTGKTAQERCATCHLLSSESSQSGPVAAESSEAIACLECHSDVLVPSGGSSGGAVRAYSGHTARIEPGERKSPPLGGNALDSLDCLTCHVSHSESQPKQLRLDRAKIPPSNLSMALDAATQLCLGCHPLAGEFRGFGRTYVRHPVGIPVTKLGNRVNDPDFPPLMEAKGTQNLSDRVIGCTTCHRIHAGNNPFLLRWSRAELPAACLKCHPEVAPSNPRR